MLLAGQLVGDRFRLGPLLGRGGMADVYRAVDEATDEPVAVKLLRGLEPSDLQRFSVEAEMLEQLDHPSIVRLRCTGTHDGQPYLVLDLVEGSTLAAELDSGPIAGERATAIVGDVAGALAHAHDRGIVHRDVKPGNVLLDDDGRAHLADFGIARLAGATALTLSGKVVGTASYLAPEQVRGRSAGPAADVYALGLVLVETLTGQRPFPGSPAESATARLHTPAPVPPFLEPWLAEIIVAMTAIDAASRPSAEAVRDALAERSSAIVVPGGSPSATSDGGTAVLPIAATGLESALPRSPVSVYVPAPEQELEPDSEPAPLSAAPVVASSGSRRLRRPSLAVVVAAVILFVVAIAAFASNGIDRPVVADTSTASTPTTAFVPTTPAPTTVTVPPPFDDDQDDERGPGRGRKNKDDD